MDHFQLTTTAQLTTALVSAYEEAASLYVTWRRASIACTRYRRRALATFCDTDPTVFGFCAVGSSLAAASVHVRETYDAAFESLGEQFAQGNGPCANALRDQLLALKHVTSGLSLACSTARPGPLDLSHIVHTSESVRRTVVRILSALYRRLALDWPSMPAELVVPKVRAQKIRPSNLRHGSDDLKQQRPRQTQQLQPQQPWQGHQQQHAQQQHAQQHQQQPQPMSPASPHSQPRRTTSVNTRHASMHTQPANGSNGFTPTTLVSPVYHGPATIQNIAPRRKPVPNSSALPEGVPPASFTPMPAVAAGGSKPPHRGASHGSSSLYFNSNPPSPPLTPDFVSPELQEEMERYAANLSYDSDSEDDHHERGSMDEAHEAAAEMGMAVAATVNNSVFSTFCPTAMALQVDRGRPAPADSPSCVSCGHHWHHPRGRPMILKDGFHLTERFLAKSHCRPRGGDPYGGVEYGCVLCTSRGKTARYATSAALGAHINDEHSKWQMLHDRDMI